MDLINMLTNPIKLQIMQYLQINGEGTTKQIAEKLSDIPAPTLYRHVNAMLKDGVLIIKEEKRVRGGVERLITINTKMVMDVENEEIAGAAYQFLMSLFLQFQKYSCKNDINPVRDMLSMRSCLLTLTDEKFHELINELGGLIDKYQNQEDRLNGKCRNISFISSPVDN